MAALTLRTSPTSPFGRKARIAAAHLGLAGQVNVRMASTDDPLDSLRQENPLGKIPVLLTPEGVLFDSPVILEYLDITAGGGRILPVEAAPRFKALRLQALCDGLLDAALLIVYETRFRAEGERSQGWLDRQAGKVAAALRALDSDIPGEEITVGTITLASALGYLDMRFAGNWRSDHPALVAWLDGFAARVPSFATSDPALPL